jgi:putative ABC transport system permease protein
MPLLRSALDGLRSLFRKEQVGRELDEELGSFLEMAAEEKIKQGMSRKDALREVRLERGSLELAREVVGAAGWESIVQTSWRDLRFGLRMLRKSPGFTTIAVLTLALAIGASTVIFSIVHAVLLTPLPYRDSSRLVVIYDREARATGLSKLMDLYQDFEAYRDRSQSFDRVAGMTWIAGNPTLTGFGASKEIHQVQATLDFFSVLGVPPALGRTFAAEDLTRGCAVVLAYPFWKDVLGAQKRIIGSTIRLDDQACDVIGVMPDTFAFFPTETQIWTLIGPNNKLERDPRHSGIAIYAHLKRGVSLSAALAELVLLHGRANEHDRHATEIQPLVLPLQEELTWLAGPNLRLSLIVLFGAVSALLLIGCGNVASLLLTRSLSRHRELAIRSALGSGLLRLLRQLLTEGLLLSLCAAALGACLAAGVIHLFNITKPIELPSAAVVRINAPVLLFTTSLSVLTTVFFGLVPAWKTSKIDLVEVLKANGQSTTQGAGKRRIARVLIVAEVTLSLVLLAGAGLLMQSAARFASIPLGFSPNRVATMSISLPPKTYGADVDRARIYDRIFDSLDAIPGVQTTAVSSMLPFRPIQGFDALEIEGQQASTPETAHHDAGIISISPRYFSALGIPVLKGRSFSGDDQLQTEAVAIVNEALVKKYFDTEDPVDRHMRSFGAPPERNPWRRIVGVVANEKRGNPFQEMSWLDTPTIFLPIAQVPPSRVTLLVRSDVDPMSLANIVQRQVSTLDPSIPVSNIQSVEHLLLKEHLAYPRFRALVVGCFAGFALLLAVVGLYGVLSQAVTQRTNEIGLRMSLGADASSILMMIAKEGMLLVSLGIVLGAALALSLSRFLAGLLYGVKSNDPMTLAAVSLLLLVSALAATLMPARRAMRVDPMVALRYE